MDLEIRKLSDFLRDHGYSMTKARQFTFEVIRDHGPVSMNELHKRTLTTVNRASLYRNVELFEALGIVHRLQIGWKYKLELSEIFSHHHHHATCTICGVVTIIHEDPEIEHAINRLGDASGFEISAHTLELKGVCKSCQE